ncbi:hypothetical protein [Aeoliella sp.]|uniref:hypothetical protein n=1 Tax=Aeoliella sp. TaxID=2795800 RepID=UPI003CCB8D25
MTNIDLTTAKPLAFPVPFTNLPSHLLICTFNHEVAAQTLGPPMLTDEVDGLGAADFWAFEYPCGLQVVFQFVHTQPGGLVLADSPEVEHVARHVPFDGSDMQRIDADALHSELDLLLSALPDRKPEIDSLHAFQVWRQGDDGNPFRIGKPTSERDAKCLVQHYEALGHKQLYWCSRVDQNPISPSP